MILYFIFYRRFESRKRFVECKSKTDRTSCDISKDCPNEPGQPGDSLEILTQIVGRRLGTVQKRSGAKALHSVGYEVSTSPLVLTFHVNISDIFENL